MCVSALEREELNKRRKEGNIDQTIYDRIQLSVFENMVKDSYLRFMNSNAWIEPLESARSEKKTPGPIKVARSDSSEVDPFMSLLQSEDGLPVFMEYCERQFCSENLQFWLAVERFKALNPQEESFNQLAEQVYNDFIKRNATIMEIGGISDVMRNRLSQQLAAPHRNMFDEVQSICYRTMKQDSYIKFIRSELWEQLEAKRLAPPAPWWRRSRGSGCCRTDTSHPTPGTTSVKPHLHSTNVSNFTHSG